MLRKKSRLMLTLPNKPDPEPPAEDEVVGKGMPSSPRLCVVLLCAEPPAGDEVTGKGMPSSPGLCVVLLCAEHRGN